MSSLSPLFSRPTRDCPGDRERIPFPAGSPWPVFDRGAITRMIPRLSGVGRVR